MKQPKSHEIDNGIALNGAKNRDNKCNTNEYAPMTNRSTNHEL